jgi:hypothetical protein
MSDEIANELDRRAKVVGGRAWGADKQKPRVYVNVGRKDVSAFFDYPECVFEPSDKQWDAVGGLGKAVLKVFVEDTGKGKEWYMTEKEKVREKLRGKLLSLMAFDVGDEELAADLAKLASLDDSVYEDLFNRLTEGDAAAAREVLAGGPAF